MVADPYFPTFFISSGDLLTSMSLARARARPQMMGGFDVVPTVDAISFTA